MGQELSRNGGGPGLNTSVHSIFGPRMILASLPERWRPLGAVVAS